MCERNYLFLKYITHTNRSFSRDITLLTKVCLVNTMDFPVITHGCDSWTIKKAERRKIDAFELWFWRRLFKNPLDGKEI